MQYVIAAILSLMALFLILLVLVQRGRGGGLAGALGGMGGQSAFGAKAGDLFTRLTMITAAIWILMCIATVKILGGSQGGNLENVKSKPGSTAPANPGDSDSK